MSISVRQVPSDPVAAPLLAFLHADMFPIPEQWDAESFASLLSGHGIRLWVAERSGEDVVGFLLAREVVDEAEILTFGVIPDMRRHGVGRMLLDAFVRDLRQQGVTQLFLEVAVTNGPACGLYEQVGFSRAGYRKNYYPDGGDALVMTASLSGEN
jgi:ribosomal-protein-alanine N-acetyltransferase